MVARVPRPPDPAAPAPASQDRRALAPSDSVGRYSVTLDRMLANPPEISTRPDIPAVARLARPPLGSSATHPEMPAVRARGTTPVVRERELPRYDGDDDEITEHTRRTDYGGPPSLPAARDRSLLLRMDGAQAGQVIALEGECSVGRHADNNVAIDDHGVSRHHAVIRREPDGYYLSDAGSRNGTYVQGQRVTHARLVDGDWIQLGPRVSFRFTLTDARQERLLRQLFDSSTRDALTGAYNRKHFDERLRIEVAYAKRHTANASLILFDIDHFKRVNDTHGHLAGDAVLRGVSVMVNSCLRAEDIFARYGGEEFAVVLRGIDLAGATRAAERLRMAIAGATLQFEGEAIPVTVSMGVASLGCVAEPLGGLLLATADRRMYAAKEAGRNRVVSAG